jgi:hypothetical protein
MANPPPPLSESRIRALDNEVDAIELAQELIQHYTDAPERSDVRAVRWLLDNWMHNRELRSQHAALLSLVAELRAENERMRACLSDAEFALSYAGRWFSKRNEYEAAKRMSETAGKARAALAPRTEARDE